MNNQAVEQYAKLIFCYFPQEMAEHVHFFKLSRLNRLCEDTVG